MGIFRKLLSDMGLKSIRLIRLSEAGDDDAEWDRQLSQIIR